MMDVKLMICNEVCGRIRVFPCVWVFCFLFFLGFFYLACSQAGGMWREVGQI